MKYTAEFLGNNLGITLNSQADALGLVTNRVEGLITFVDDIRYVPLALKNPHIAIILTTRELAVALKPSQAEIVVMQNPKFHFFKLFNTISSNDSKLYKTKIDPTAQIHSQSFIADHGVTISAGATIGPNTTILEGSIIGNQCRIGANTVIGCDGFEYKRNNDDIIRINHDGIVLIKDNVDIGSGCVVVKGISIYGDTIIDDRCKIDNMVHISHSSKIGSESFIMAGARICGSAVIKSKAYIGPGSIISNGVTFGDEARASIGAVVTSDIVKGSTVTGNFAIPHEKFLHHLKKMLKG